MGMSASQARLLTLTARIHDVEYAAQSIQNAKLALATQEDEVYQNYLEALDSTTFTVKDNSGNRIVANFNSLCGIDAAKASKISRYVLRDDKNRILVSDDMYNAYNKFKSQEGGDAYKFAMYMMTGQKDGWDDLQSEGGTGQRYKEAENQVMGKQDEYSSALKDSQAALIELITNALAEFDYNSANDFTMTKEEVAADMNKGYETLKSLGDAYANPSAITDVSLREKVNSNKSNYNKAMQEISAAYDTYRYNMYTQYAESIFEQAGNNKNDFDEDDFWYYVNMYKQIEANGRAIVNITDYNGLDGIGNAATDSDWLQEMVKSGRITIDISTLDNKGNLSFSSTGVSSDSSLEYTTTSTIDKSKLAKAEAEYEHKMKEINQKDKKFDMDLNRLETERTALNKEYDSVKKVIQDNIDKSFGIFS